jgi:hypothetical protein
MNENVVDGPGGEEGKKEKVEWGWLGERER